jgi:tryptophanyl-tRNA synthetase
MAVDIAQSFNYVYGCDAFKIPQPFASEETKTVLGLDGRKMSKSYNNTIPLFTPEKQLRKLLMKIVTNSQSIEEPKDPDTCSIFALYKHFSTKEMQEALRQRYLAGGMGWGHAKQELFEAMNSVLSPLREKYNYLMQNQDYINQVLGTGSDRARELAAMKITKLRKIVGID